MGSPGWGVKLFSQRRRASWGWPELKAAVGRGTMSSAVVLLISSTLEQRNRSARKSDVVEARRHRPLRRHRPRRRTIQYAARSRFYLWRRRLLDTRFRGYDGWL